MTPWWRSRRAAWTCLLVIIVAAGGVIAMSTVIVRRTILDPSTYTDALVAADVYERTYTEVLADPELATISDELLGELHIDPSVAVQGRALATSALRWVLPPSTIRSATETAIVAAVSHIRGESDRLEIDVDVTAALERIDHAAAARTTAILATVDREQIATTLAEYRDLVAEFLADAAEGTVPGTVPSLSVSDADAAAVVDAIVTSVGFEIDDDLRYRVELYVAAGREGDALLALASELIERHARDAADDLAVDLGTARGRLFDVAAAIDRRHPRDRRRPRHRRCGRGVVQAPHCHRRRTVRGRRRVGHRPAPPR